MPAVDLRDIGALLQRAGFALPVVDRDVVTVRYGSAFELWRDLRAMGATNVLAERDRRPAGRRLFLRTAEIYAERFSDPDGRVRGDLRDHLAVGVGAAREPAEAGAARIRDCQAGRCARSGRRRPR